MWRLIPTSCLLEERAQLRAVHAVRDVEEIELVLRLDQVALSMGRRTSDEQNARVGAGRQHRGVEGIRHRQRERPPHRRIRDCGGRNQRIEGDQPVEVARIGRLEISEPAFEIRMALVLGPGQRLRQEPDRRGAVQDVERLRRHDLGPERDDDVGIERADRGDHRPGVGARAVVDERRFDLRALVGERTGLEVGRLADEGEPQRRPRAR